MTEAEFLAAQRLRSRKYAAANREKLNAHAREYRAANPSVVRATLKKSRENHREKRLEYGAAYRAAHTEERRAKAKAKRQESNVEKRAADRIYRIAHPEQFRKSKQKYRSANGVKERERKREYNLRNKGRIADAHRAYVQANRGRIIAIAQRRHAAKMSACPSWANHDTIREFYDESERLSRETGVRYEVDHVIPLQNPRVCGLHCEINLQILTREENRAKWNRLPGDSSAW